MRKINTMKIMVVGYGSIGKRHIDNLLKINDCSVIICTKRKDIDNKIKEKCKIVESIERGIIEKPDVSFITNVTNNHISSAIKLAESGSHLFIEKPLSNSLTGLDKLTKIVKKKKLVTMVGCNLRFHECIKTIKEILKKDIIGKVVIARAESGSFLPDWHPYEDYRRSYAARKELGGGVILTCIHELDYLYWFFGKIDSVFSHSGKYSDLEIDTEDFSVALLKFKNKIIGEVQLNFFQKPEFRSCKIIGTNGTIYWNSNTNIVKVFDTNKKKWINKIVLSTYDRNEMYMKELKYFLECVKQNKKTMNDVNNASVVLKTALGIVKSSKMEKVVKI